MFSVDLLEQLMGNKSTKGATRFSFKAPLGHSIHRHQDEHCFYDGSELLQPCMMQSNCFRSTGQAIKECPKGIWREIGE